MGFSTFRLLMKSTRPTWAGLRPAVISPTLLVALHSSALGGHSGMKATYHRIKQIFYWPGLKSEVDKFVAECPVCQKNKGETCAYPGLLDPLHIPDMVWTHISMDFIEGL